MRAARIGSNAVPRAPESHVKPKFARNAAAAWGASASSMAQNSSKACGASMVAPQKPEGLGEPRIILRLVKDVRDDDLLAVEAV